MLEQLRKALGEREEARARMIKLRELAERGEAKGEESRALFREYRQRFEQANEQVKGIREALRNELEVLEASFQAYEAQMQRLRSEANITGAISPEKYQKELARNTEGKQRVREQIRYTQRLISAHTPNDLSGVVAPAYVARKSGSTFTGAAPEKGHIALRITQVVAGLFILAGVYVPLISIPFMGPVSLFSGIRMVSSLPELGLPEGETAWLNLAWIIPTLLGLSIGLVAVIPRRYWRGGITLPLAVAMLLSMVTGLVIVLAYPRVGPLFQAGQLEDEITSMISGTVAPIISCFVIGTFTAYIVCLINLLPSKVGQLLWGLSLALLVFYGVGLGFYFKLGLKAEPAVQLALGEPQSYRHNLRIIVENQGNFPLELVSDQEVASPFESPKKKSPAELERYQYMLVLQREGHDGVWEKAETSVLLGGGFLGTSKAFVEPGKKQTFGSSVKPTEEMRSYRVALLGANDVPMYSNAVTVEGVPEGTGIAINRTKPPSEEEAAARRAVDELVEAALSMPLDRLSQMADETRQMIYKVGDRSIQQELLRQVDETLLPPVEQEVLEDLNQAQTEYNRGRLDQAEKRVRQGMDRYQRYLRSSKVDLESREVHRQCQGLLQAVGAAKHPGQYYRIKRINAIGDMTEAVVVDQAGNEYRLREDGEFGFFIVKEIDPSAEELILDRNGQTKIIRK